MLVELVSRMRTVITRCKSGNEDWFSSKLKIPATAIHSPLEAVCAGRVASTKTRKNFPNSHREARKLIAVISSTNLKYKAIQSCPLLDHQAEAQQPRKTKCHINCQNCLL